MIQVVEVLQAVQGQQANIMKAFYLDLLLPLESNLDKDTKVVQVEQKKFLQQHKQRSENYTKAVVAVKKLRKKNKTTLKAGIQTEKEVKQLQLLEEEKQNLHVFCEESLRVAIIQERRRYGFLLERHCSLAKHCLALHTEACSLLQRYLPGWIQIAESREYLPESVEVIFRTRLRPPNSWLDDSLYPDSRDQDIEEDRQSISSQLRKTKSMDASCLDMRSISEAIAVVSSPMKPLSRAKSEYNLYASTQTLVPEPHMEGQQANAMSSLYADVQLARAIHTYLSKDENQLSFHEGDLLSIMNKKKGWFFGENLRTQCYGWFPIAYTLLVLDDVPSPPSHQKMVVKVDITPDSSATTPVTPTKQILESGASVSSPCKSFSPQSGNFGKAGSAAETPRSGKASVTFGDVTEGKPAPALKKPVWRGPQVCSTFCPPPSLPVPLSLHKPVGVTTHPQSSPAGRVASEKRLLSPPPMPPVPEAAGNSDQSAATTVTGDGGSSLHSSNDSGFSNETHPVQENVSDDDCARARKNIFATVKLRKTKTNDRSAPFLH